MPKVFISHSVKDREFVEREIVSLLKSHGVDTWYAQDEIQAADRWERSILQGLEACDWFLVVMSPRSAKSEWVKDEVHWAIENRDGKIIPALLQDCDGRDFHLRMTRLQHVDFRNNLKEARRRLLALLGVTSVSDPAPPLPDLKKELQEKPVKAQRSQRRWWAVGAGVAAAALLGCLALWAIVGRSGSPSTSPEEDRRSPPAGERPIVSTRQPIGLHRQLQLLHDDLEKVDAPARPHVRYLSLMAVHDNPYISNAEFDLHLDALQIVLNRLSWEKPKVPIQPVDASGCLRRIDLRDLGWEASKEWALLLRAEPYGVRYDEANPDAALRKLAGDIDQLTDFNVPCVRADWLIAAATCAPLFDQLQQLDGQERRTPPFDLTDNEHPVAQVVQLYRANAIDARVAAAELGLGTVAELDARWPADKPELRKALDQLVPRSRWAGENGPGGFEEYVRTLKLGVPRTIQPIH